MAIVISAFACSENRGSEHELGWKCIKECAARSDEVHLFTSVAVNPGIYVQIHKHELNSVVVHGVDFCKAVDFVLKSIPWGCGYQVAAYVWEFRLWLHMFGRYPRRGFELGIKSTYGSYRWPSFLWYFSQQFHLDPLSGGGRCPLRFHRFLSARGRSKEMFRLFLQYATLCDPFVLLTLLKATKIFAGNAATRSILPGFARQKCVVKQDFLTIEASDFKIEEARATVSRDSSVLKILYTGKLLEWKGIKLILEALALLPEDVNYVFTLMGNGPARKFYQDYIEKKQLHVVFVDPKQVPRCDLSFYFLSHDIFAFPTLHGEAGYAAVEANLHGMKLLTLDSSGLSANLSEGDLCIQTEGRSADEVVQAVAHSIEGQYRQFKA